MMTETMSLKNSVELNKGTNVQVAVRCRPLNAEERKSGAATVVNCDVENKAVKVAYGPAGKKIMKNFTFDKVFGMYSRQEEVFDSVVRPIVEETLAGFNCTIFAYGQTGTGYAVFLYFRLLGLDELQFLCCL
jgi:kinesin family protein 11